MIKGKFGAIWQVFLAMVLLLSLGLVIAIHTSTPVLAATITSNKTGYWDTASTWNGGAVPSTTDNVIIQSGHTVTIRTAQVLTCGDIQIAGQLTFAGDTAELDVRGGGTSPVTTGAVSGSGTLYGVTTGGCNIKLYGNWSFSGTITNRVSVSFQGPSDATVSAIPATGQFRNIYFEKAANTTLYLSVTPQHNYNFYMTSGSICYNQNGAQNVIPATYPANLTLAGSGAKTLPNSKIVDGSSSSPQTTTVVGVLSMEGTATATVTGTLTYGASATLQYNRTASQAAGPEWITPFAATGGVIIANTGTVTLPIAKVVNAPLTINSGAALATANYALTFGGNFVNNGGTFTAGSSAISITGTATQSIAGFNTTGTVSMTKTGGTATFTGNVNGGALTISGSGGTLNLGSGLTHNFTGTWTRTNGTLSGNSSTLNLGGSLSGTGGTFTAGTSTVNYYGAAQTIAAVTYNNLIINQSSGSASLNGDVTVNGVLTLTNGGITTGSNKVIIAASGSVSRTSGHIIGNLQKYVATGSDVSRTFEVGTASGYDPVNVTFDSVSVAGNLITNATAGEHPNIGTSAINSSMDVNVYWSFTNSGITFTNYDATFNFIAGDIDGGADATNFIVGKYDADWTYPTVGTKTSTSTQATGVTSLSDFVLGEAAAPTLTETFSTNSTFTVPAGVYQITVDAWGGGGGGGGRGTSGTGGAGGGGGGAYARTTINVTPGEIYNVTVGGGGAGGPAGNNPGSAGGDSYFYKTGGANLTLAKGGAGGAGGISGAGGAGGSNSSCVGDVRFSGGNGAAGSATTYSGGGGGGAGNQTAGGNATTYNGGNGGTYDGGDGADGRSGSSSGAGSAGSELGGGGSGAYRSSGSWAGGGGARGEVRITYKPAPDAPALYPENDVQIAFNNIRQNTTTPIFRVSATHTGNFTNFKLELNTAPDFTGTAYRQTFSGNYSPGTQYNLNATGLSPSLPATDGITYYVRVRASADGGAHWSTWSTVNYPVWTFTYKSTDELPDWFQTTDAQFGTGILSNTATDLPNGRVKLSLVTTTPTWYTADQQTNSGTGTSGSVPKPTNMTAGDLVILVIATQNSPSSSSTGITPPGNFTLIRFEQDTSSTARPEVVAYWKIATGSEPANYTFTVASGNGYWKAIAGRVTGYNSTNPIGNNNGTNSGGTGVTSLAIAGITTSTNNVLLIGAVVARGDSAAPTSFVKPTSMDGLWAMNGSGTGSSGYPGTGGGKEIFATAGGTGTRTFTWTGGSRAAGLMFEILPGEVVAPSGTITSPAIEFGWVTQASNWGEVQVHATTATNNSITVQVLNAVGSAISGKNVTIQNGGSSGSINLTDLSPTGNNATLYLKATLNNNGGGTPYLNDWMLTWVAAAPVPSTITVTAPSAIAFATLVWGDNVKSSVTNGTVTVTLGGSATGWQVTAKNVTGYMKAGNTTLANKLQISKDGSAWAYADVGITYNGTAAGNYTLPFWAKQVINTNEVVGAYSIIIEFTGEILY